MENLTKPKVNLNEIIDAFEMENYYSRSFVNKMTGEVVNLMGNEDLSDVDEDVEDEFIPEHYISLPDKWDLNKCEMMKDFCYSIDDEEMQNKLLYTIGGKGTFGRFHTAISCYNIEKEWYRFLHERLKEIAIKFCTENHLNYRYSPRKYIPNNFRSCGAKPTQ